MPDVELLSVARRARERAYAPYSGFRVGAAVRAESGAVYPGCNIENASYGLTLCAEQVAVAQAVSSGERRLVAIAVSAESADAVWPCGRCRQMLLEFGPDMAVLTEGPDGEPLRRTLADLLPDAFGAEAMR